MSARAYASRRPVASRRPAQRRRPAARRGQSRVNWERLGRVALTLVLAAVLVSYLNPMISFVEAYRGTSAAKQRLHVLLAENRQLHDRVQDSDDPVIVEREARRQGLIQPGERPYVVDGLNK